MSAFFADFLCGLVKVRRKSVCSVEDGPGCSCDGIVTKPTPESPHAYVGSLCQKELFLMDVGNFFLLYRLLSDVLSQGPLLIPILDEYMTDGSSMGLSHDVIDPPPEALVLLLVYNGQNILFPLFILTLLCIPEAVMEMLLPILLTVLPEIVTLFQADLEL